MYCFIIASHLLLGYLACPFQLDQQLLEGRAFISSIGQPPNTLWGTQALNKCHLFASKEAG